MNITQLKARLKECTSCTHPDVLLQLICDSLKHIEELEQGTGNAVIVKQNEVIIQLQSQLREREAELQSERDKRKMAENLAGSNDLELRQCKADCAAMRDALEEWKKFYEGDENLNLCYKRNEKALSSNAGGELLERLKAVEKELEQKKVRVARLSLAAIEAKECITEWVEAGLITLSPDDEVLQLLEQALQKDAQ